MHNILISILYSFIVFPVLAQEIVIRAVTHPIPFFVESEKSGLFIQMVGDISAVENMKVKFEILPSKRAFEFFKNNKNVDIVFPAFKGAIKSKHYSSIPIFYKKDFIFHLTGHKLNSQKKEQICLVRGYPYSEFYQKYNFEKIFTNSDVSCIKMLKSGRVQYFIGEFTSALRAAESQSVHNIVILKNSGSSTPIYFFFQDTVKGKMLQEKFDIQLKALFKSGEMEKYFKEIRAKAQKQFSYDYNPLVP